MQLRQGQTPEPSPQHYCIFKPLSPCGNSQFDDADLQCWQATATISFSKTKQKRMQFTMLFLSKIPLSLWSSARLPRESLKEKAAKLQKSKVTGLLGCLSVTVKIKRPENSYQIIAIIPIWV